MLVRLAMESPFRIITRALLKWLPISARSRSLWDISPRPAYLLGVLAGADQAAKERETDICVIEFGVAGGEGLLALEEAARIVEKETGVNITVYGFDNGSQGLPNLSGDYRDHPDFWKAGDFPMDVDLLKSRMSPRTELIIGDVAKTVSNFVTNIQKVPVGFAAIDLDLYSSTRDALLIISHDSKKMLKHVPLYFDDIDFIINHKFAGELLAISEFNQINSEVKIDRWYGVKWERPFPERSFLDKMYVAHDLKTISETSLNRDNVSLPLRT